MAITNAFINRSLTKVGDIKKPNVDIMLSAVHAGGNIHLNTAVDAQKQLTNPVSVRQILP